MGHGSSNCYTKPKCVKCAGSHITKDCTKSPQDTPKCANCDGPHTANATICTFYKQQLQKIETNRARNNEKYQTKNIASSTGHLTNRTLQHQRRNEQFPALPVRPTLVTPTAPTPTAPMASSRHIPDRKQRTDIYMEKQALCEIWRDFGVVGTPATDSAGSIRVYTHSTETRSSAPSAVMLRQSGQREGNICSLVWGTSLVSLLLTL